MKKELLIFGANSSLGKGVINILASAGYDKIYLFARSAGDLNSNAENTEFIKVESLEAEPNIQKAFESVIPSAEKLFFLFNAIGAYTGGKEISDTGIEDLDKMINSNIKTNFLLAKYFSKLVKSSAGGSICFTTAYVGIYPEKGKGAYGLSKAALIHLIKTLALEGAGFNLTANAVAPFIIDTPANREWMKEDAINKALKPEEIGLVIRDIFNNFKITNGNIFELKDRLNILQTADN